MTSILDEDLARCLAPSVRRVTGYAAIRQEHWRPSDLQPRPSIVVRPDLGDFRSCSSLSCETDHQTDHERKKDPNANIWRHNDVLCTYIWSPNDHLADRVQRSRYAGIASRQMSGLSCSSVTSDAVKLVYEAKNLSVSQRHQKISIGLR